MLRGAHNMTEGSIPRHLLLYCLPVVLGDLFQVTYNTVDSIIVGRFAGAGALASVGVANPIMNIALFFMVGMGIGASVLMSGFYGAGDVKTLRREFTTAMVSGTLIGAGVSVLLFLLSRPLLLLCRTPGAILPDTVRYLQIVALGIAATGGYNLLAAASRSVGDTRTPLCCLIAGSLVNIGLDLLFVGVFSFGVAGAAAATVVSQAISALLCLILLRRSTGDLFFGRGGPLLDRELLRKTLQFSYASALQQAGIYVGKLLVQFMVNPLGVDSIAAFNAVNRIDDYAILPERDIAGGETVLVAQNRGAGRTDRMRAGLRVTLAAEVVYGVLASLVIFFFAHPLMRLFVSADETEVLRIGARYLRLMGLFYFLPGVTNAFQGYMRAVGKMRLTMFVTYGQMLTRALFTFLLIGRLRMEAIPFACAAGWILMTVWEGGLILKWRRNGALNRNA